MTRHRAKDGDTAPTPRNDDERWRAVLAHERGADGTFVYGVRSTGVFCRPSCASRRPLRRHVEFFASGDEARAHGYRACRRCRPDTPSLDPWVEKIRRACVSLANVEGRASLATLSKRVGGSPYHFQRNFKRLVGVTPRQFAEACRLDKMKARLRRGVNVTSAIFDAGYGSSSRFYEKAAGRLGMAPARYRKGGDGMSITYTVVTSPLGALLVAATERGVCAVSMGSDATGLERALSQEYPRASIARDAASLTPWVEEILGRLKGQAPRLDLPLDVQATAFQWQVWSALTAIPPGETRTYADVAASIGRPGAARAVAGACAANPVALAVPCHRVLPAQGGTGGYRWGVARKRALLDAEARKHG